MLNRGKFTLTKMKESFEIMLDNYLPKFVLYCPVEIKFLIHECDTLNLFLKILIIVS